ncbi:hypothetical protein BT69DRAFT_1288655, partial [Atractiella rhizophila]
MAPNEREAVRWSGDDAKERQVERFGSFASLRVCRIMGLVRLIMGWRRFRMRGGGGF